MTRRLPAYTPAEHGKLLLAGEPLIFHCNHYNYWLQHALRLVDAIDMDDVIVDAAASVAHATLVAARTEMGLETANDVLEVAGDIFSQSGFGRMDFTDTTADGGVVRTPTSHYGQTLTSACIGEIKRPQNLFDRGFAAGVLAAAHEQEAGAFRVSRATCMAVGAELGEIELQRRPTPTDIWNAPGRGPATDQEVPGPASGHNVDEAGILEALSGLDFSGNEEGLTPRFGVILTHHFANFYNRISFEFAQRMDGLNLRDEGETLLVDAGHRCAFNTFGGIMVSAEWDAVVRPQLKTADDWVHGMVAVVNALGWGVWRVHELSDAAVTIRIYDDYESCGYLGMYGKSDRPVSFLHLGGVAGLMNLIRVAAIDQRPALDEALYQRVFTSGERFEATTLQSFAMGAPFTEIRASR